MLSAEKQRESWQRDRWTVCQLIRQPDDGWLWSGIETILRLVDFIWLSADWDKPNRVCAAHLAMIICSDSNVLTAANDEDLHDEKRLLLQNLSKLLISSLMLSGLLLAAFIGFSLSFCWQLLILIVSYFAFHFIHWHKYTERVGFIDLHFTVYHIFAQ